jgi:hypothetical protein
MKNTEEAARIIHTQILMGESANFKEIKRASELIAHNQDWEHDYKLLAERYDNLEKNALVLHSCIETLNTNHDRVRKCLEDQCLEADALLETERLRLAACGVAAMANTPTTARERITPDSPYYSASYSDVCRMVDREMCYREALDKIIHELGVPQPGYPQPVAKAYEIAMKALKVKP